MTVKQRGAAAEKEGTLSLLLERVKAVDESSLSAAESLTGTPAEALKRLLEGMTTAEGGVEEHSPAWLAKVDCWAGAEAVGVPLSGNGSLLFVAGGSYVGEWIGREDNERNRQVREFIDYKETSMITD